MSQSFAKLIGSVRAGCPRVAIAYSTSLSWPLPTSELGLRKPKQLNIHILDSSFNPPTKAHLALARSVGKESSIEIHRANLLLLSISNADKTLSSNDASYIQRLEMMVLMANTMAAKAPLDHGGVAVAVINEPIFARKQKILTDFLPQVVLNRFTKVDLVWQVGVDTLNRLFDQKYYENNDAKMIETLSAFLQAPEETHMGAKLLCARREILGVELDCDALTDAEQFKNSGRVELVDIGEWESRLSSTSVREKIRQKDEDWVKLCDEGVCEYIKYERLYQ